MGSVDRAKKLLDAMNFWRLYGAMLENMAQTSQEFADKGQMGVAAGLDEQRIKRNAGYEVVFNGIAGFLSQEFSDDELDELAELYKSNAALQKLQNPALRKKMMEIMRHPPEAQSAADIPPKRLS